MLHLTTGEQRERAQQFDAYVEAGLEVLNNPSVAQHFTLADLQTLNDALGTAILPNVRHNKISIPLGKLFTYAPVIVPADRDLYPRVSDLVENSETWALSCYVYEGETVHSPRYGQTYPRPTHSEPIDPNRYQNSKAEERYSDELACTTVGQYLPGKSGDKYTQGRPLVTFRTEALEQSSDFIGSLALHEAMHCQDYLEHGPIDSLEYLVATELRAYQAGCAIANEYGQTEGIASVARLVEKQRQKWATAAAEYVVDPTLVAWMVEKQLVN